MRIGPYEVLGELGRGGMGVVYRVRAPGGGEAALKVLLRADAEAFARFQRERRLLAELGEAEGFVPLRDAGKTSADGAWLVMALVPGGTLRARLEAGPLGVAETIALGREVATALGRAHERGIVHRDVKPENVLFAASGRALLSDLGLAKHFDPGAEGASVSVDLTLAGAFKGTAGYTAPEQLEDAASVGPPADVFALGAVLYECLAGRPAFQGENVVEVVAKLTSRTREPIGRQDVPAWLEEIVFRALDPDPRVRFLDGASLARALAAPAKPVRAKEAGSRRVLVPALLGALVGALALAAAFAGMRGTRPATVQRPPVKPSVVPPAPVPPPFASDLSTHDLVVLGQAKIKAHELDEAIAALDRAIQLDPTLAAAWAERGAAREEKGDRDGAIADLTKAIELAPELALLWANRGSMRHRKGDLDGAIADGTRAIELDPTLAFAWAERGGARFEKGDREGALADDTRSLELDPSEATTWMNRGVARRAGGDLQGALADDTRALELAPRLVAAWSERGNLRYEAADWDSAIADFTRAIELDEKSAALWESRGSARSHKQEWDEEIADLTRAIALDRTRSVCWANRGFAHKQKGEWKEAVRDFGRALELSPGADWAPNVRGDLEEARKHFR